MSLKILSNKTLIRTSIISHLRAQKNCFLNKIRTNKSAPWLSAFVVFPPNVYKYLFASTRNTLFTEICQGEEISAVASLPKAYAHVIHRHPNSTQSIYQTIYVINYNIAILIHVKLR